MKQSGRTTQAAGLLKGQGEDESKRLHECSMPDGAAGGAGTKRRWFALRPESTWDTRKVQVLQQESALVLALPQKQHKSNQTVLWLQTNADPLLASCCPLLMATVPLGTTEAFYKSTAAATSSGSPSWVPAQQG
jgi:hypothetical protein